MRLGRELVRASISICYTKFATFGLDGPYALAIPFSSYRLTMCVYVLYPPRFPRIMSHVAINILSVSTYAL